MKLGMSSYSFRPLLANGGLTIESMFDWMSNNGAEHLEIATFSFSQPGHEAEYDLVADAETLGRIRAETARTGIPISGICMGAKFAFVDDAERRAQIDQVKRHVELCNRLEVGFLRHDVVLWSQRLTSAADFEDNFSGIVDACQEIADFAAGQGVTTSVEDHGFFMNGSGRVQRLLHAVDRPNFKFTVDVGNFLCVDEDAVVATRASLTDASFVHLKDFYVRRTSPGPGWLETLGGQFIRGSVFGFGDLETRMILEAVVASGYDGFVSLEYEGAEPTLSGCETGLANIRRMLGDIRGA
ncbi:sugar phosphate isomerase/epimerase family protein [Devosia sp. SL43]|uniref:sugar phosphate isomerase/epimerase family protein n=1 Tax=Devosia sp. SL43 TaxID=2806348 RepID=UPI001F27A5BD|nr:sugar phosphate isomerase/epimerase family protein [Devosia sp. SL43]UJW86247.1 sugar phosphate isomerase/epimerase [Devosia sp. SL43]